MATMQTRELTGRALEWAVAKCEGKEVDPWEDFMILWLDDHLDYTSNWALGGEIKSRERISTVYQPDGQVQAFVGTNGVNCYGPDELTAVMRVIVFNKLGFEIEVPDELLAHTKPRLRRQY